MSYAKQILEGDTASTVDAGLLAATIEALSDCAQACTADADADLREDDAGSMVTCIRLCLDCTDLCTATVGVISRHTAYHDAVTGPPANRPTGTSRAVRPGGLRRWGGGGLGSNCVPIS